MLFVNSFKKTDDKYELFYIEKQMAAEIFKNRKSVPVISHKITFFFSYFQGIICKVGTILSSINRPCIKPPLEPWATQQLAQPPPQKIPKELEAV